MLQSPFTQPGEAGSPFANSPGEAGVHGHDHQDPAPPQKILQSSCNSAAPHAVTARACVSVQRFQRNSGGRRHVSTGQAEASQALQQAVFCFALAPAFGLGLPVFFETMTRATRDVFADWAIVWAPALAATCGLLVRRLGRRAEARGLNRSGSVVGLCHGRRALAPAGVHAVRASVRRSGPRDRLCALARRRRRHRRAFAVGAPRRPQSRRARTDRRSTASRKPQDRPFDGDGSKKPCASACRSWMIDVMGDGKPAWGRRPTLNPDRMRPERLIACSGGRAAPKAPSGTRSTASSACWCCKVYRGIAAAPATARGWQCVRSP